MRLARLGSFLILAVIAAPGCRMAGVDNVTRRETPVVPPTVDVAKIIEENNRNASRIESLRAPHLSLVVTTGRESHGVGGKLAMERPRNFKLELDSQYKGPVAEIGSNDEKFWFWSRFDPEKKSYFCKYDDSGTSPLAATLQPDWIVEALGLRVIPEDEANEITVSRGTEQPNTIVLTHRPSQNGSEVVIRKTILLESSHQILEHRLYSQKMELLAKAKIERYQNVLVPGEDGQNETVTLPEKMTIEWVREQMAMRVTLPRAVEINPELSDSARDELFAESSHSGYRRFNLASTNPRPRGGVTTIRESLPPPARGVRLGSPEPEVTDGAEDQNSQRNEVDPEAVTASLPPGQVGDLVEPAIPRAPEIQFAKPTRASGWIESATPYIEQ